MEDHGEPLATPTLEASGSIANRRIGELGELRELREKHAKSIRRESLSLVNLATGLKVYK